MVWTTVSQGSRYLTGHLNSLLDGYHEGLKVRVQNEAELMTRRLINWLLLYAHLLMTI